MMPYMKAFFEGARWLLWLAAVSGVISILMCTLGCHVHLHLKTTMYDGPPPQQDGLVITIPEEE